MSTMACTAVEKTVRGSTLSSSPNDEHITTAVQYVGKTSSRLDDVYITSFAVLTRTFKPLIYKSTAPKVIDVTSELGSIANALDPSRRMVRVPVYGVSKVSMNGLTTHLQAVEDERAAAASGDGGWDDE
ncbi:hypothetical protein B0T21DRAFT_412330 [Apiosordaria backusii]|uniref:Uncharacterized protein n=1 Tax=Apiosordaria backusii TaxID=314023 RepID=A0AA40BK58_9PEZI|nr:hypothetical protein B0T21DRAFT_412330 [Apiosordaria backusii]